MEARGVEPLSSNRSIQGKEPPNPIAETLLGSSLTARLHCPRKVSHRWFYRVCRVEEVGGRISAISVRPQCVPQFAATKLQPAVQRSLSISAQPALPLLSQENQSLKRDFSFFAHKRSTLTSILDRLATRNLITREVGKTDRRTFIVTLTSSSL
jgi:hypothetical protein